MKEFVYTLVLIDRLFVEDNWTQKEEAIISRHFKHLVDLETEGKLILAGKTDGLDPNTKGLVFFQAESMKKAQEIMDKDPAIMEGIMSGTLQEFNIALLNNQYKK
jgi:uncharacterized protein YciI